MLDQTLDACAALGLNERYRQPAATEVLRMPLNDPIWVG